MGRVKCGCCGHNLSFGDAYIDSIAEEIQDAFPGIKGFYRRGLYRMKKFYETYKSVLRFAKDQGIAPGIVVGRMQLEGMIN